MVISNGNKGSFRLFTLVGQLWRREDVESLEKQVSLCISAGKPRIVLELDRLSFVNSHALGLFVRLHKRCSEKGGKLILYKPESSVREIIEIAALPQFMTVVHTAEELEAQTNTP